MLQRLNYGIVFQERTNIIISNEHWLHTYEIIMPDHVNIPNIGTCHKDNSTCALITHVLSNINMIRAETAIRLNNTIETIRTLIPEARVQTSRSKRSLLPFIGDLSRSLFGTATINDVNMLAKHINALNKESRQIANALTQHETHLSSFMVKANHRMDKLMQGIKDNYIAINYIHSQLDKNVKTLEDTFQQMISILSTQIKSATHINHELDELKTGIIDLVNGKLSPLILPKTVLDSTLTDIQNILTTKYSGFYLTQTSTEIYASSNFLFARNGTKLYLTVKLPISHYKEALTVYKITSLPVPINSTAAHGTQLLDMPDNLIVTSNQQFYSPLTNSQLAQCKGGKIKQCSYNLALAPVTTESCILALYLNIRHKIKQFCDFRFVHNVLQSKVIELNPSSIILYQTPLLSMECGKEHKMIKGCNFCIIKVPCQCSFTTTNFYLAPRLTVCQNKSQVITKLHPVNLALMQHFFDNAKIEDIFANTMYKIPINMSVPHFKFYTHDMNKIITDDQQNHLSLSKMADAAKRDAKIFQSLAELLLAGDIRIDSQWPDLNAILIFNTMGTTTASICLLIWTFRKIKTLSTAVLALQLGKGIDAMPTTLPSFVYQANNAITESETHTQNILNDLKWEHAMISLLALISVILIIFLYTFTRKRKTPTLCLEITNTRRSILINIIQLPLCPSHCTVTDPGTVSNVDVIENCMAPKLSIQWQTFSLSNDLSHKLIELPKQVPLSLKEAHMIKKIMKRPFFVFLYMKHYNLLIPLQNTGLVV